MILNLRVTASLQEQLGSTYVRTHGTPQFALVHSVQISDDSEGIELKQFSRPIAQNASNSTRSAV